MASFDLDIQSLWKKISQENLGLEFLEKIDFLDKIFEEKEKVCIDLGASAIKVVHLHSGPGEISLQNVVYREIPPAALKESRDDAIAKTLMDIFKENKIKAKKVRLVLSDPAIYTRHITIPKVSEEELVKAIKWQAEKYVPFPVDGAAVDFQTLDSDGPRGQGQVEIVLAAIENKIIDKYLEILKNAKLTPSVLNIVPFSAAKAIAKNYSIPQDELMPVVDIGAKTTYIVIMKGNSLRLVRSVDLGGDVFTDAIAKGMNVGKAEAERIKRESSVDEFGNKTGSEYVSLYSIIEPKISELIAEINRSIAYCEKEFPMDEIQKVILSGGGSRLSGLDRALREKLSLSVETADVFQNVRLGKKDVSEESLKDIASLVVPALGEAL